MDFTAATGNFINWVVSSGYQISPKIQIADLRGQAQGRGIIALQDIKEDEVLFTIPRNAILNIETGTLSNVSVENREKLLTKYNHWEGLILTILFEISLGDNSKWAPYFKILPEKFHSLMYWTDEQLKSLQPSLVLDRIGKDKALETYNRLIPSALNDLGMNIDVSLETFHQVASTILSYSFDVERPDFDEDQEDDEIVKYDGYYKSMVALADTLNADTHLSNANLFYEPDCLVMKAVRDIQKGQQVYNTYGDHPNSELLRRYGFVEWQGSKFDFGEIPLINVQNVYAGHFKLDSEFVEQIFESIAQAEVEEIEEDIILDSYDCYSDGEVLPESKILIQTLTTLAQIHQMQPLTLSTVQKTVNRVLKKCYQLVESNTMTREAVLLWELIVQSRINEYPSHSFRRIPEELTKEDRVNYIKMSELVLKSELDSLKICCYSFAKGKIIDDDKLIRNVLKRKAEAGNSENRNVKRQRH